MLKKIICLISICITVLCFIGCNSNTLDVETESEPQYEYARFGVDGGYYYFENDGKIMHITNDKNKHDKNADYFLKKNI